MAVFNIVECKYTIFINDCLSYRMTFIRIRTTCETSPLHGRHVTKLKSYEAAANIESSVGLKFVVSHYDSTRAPSAIDSFVFYACPLPWFEIEFLFSKLNAYKCAMGRCVQQSSSIDDIDSRFNSTHSISVSVIHCDVTPCGNQYPGGLEGEHFRICEAFDKITSCSCHKFGVGVC